MVKAIPSGSDLLNLVKDTVDVPGPIDKFCETKSREITKAAEAVMSSSETSGRVVESKNSAEILKETGLNELREANKLAKDLHESDRDV